MLLLVWLLEIEWGVGWRKGERANYVVGGQQDTRQGKLFLAHVVLVVDVVVVLLALQKRVIVVVVGMIDCQLGWNPHRLNCFDDDLIGENFDYY